MTNPSDNSNGAGCVIDDSVQEKFFANARFCLSAQEYLQNILGVSIAIILGRGASKASDTYRIHILDIDENRAQTEHAVPASVANPFEKMQSRMFTHDKSLSFDRQMMHQCRSILRDVLVQEWFSNTSTKFSNLACLQKILDERIQYLFTVCQDKPKRSLKIYYFPRELSGVADVGALIRMIETEIVQETIALPFEFGRLQHNGRQLEDVSIFVDRDHSNREAVQKSVTLFGSYEAVDRSKKDLSAVIARCEMTTFPLTSLDTAQVHQ